MVNLCDGKILGYAYASRYRVRDGYRFTVECSVYVSSDVHRQGVGTMLYEALFEELKKEKDSFKDMGIDYEEKAFYDIV